MTTTKLESELLAAIAAETSRVEGLSPYRDDYATVREWVDRGIAVDDLPRFGVRIPDAAGHSAADRKARQRCLEAMERSGLITLHTPAGQRRTHAKLTAAGRKLAKASTETPAQPATDAKGSAR